MSFFLACIKTKVHFFTYSENKILKEQLKEFKKKDFKNEYLTTENKNLKRWEDFDLWLKISKKTNKFYYVAEPLGFYWVNNNSFKKLFLEKGNEMDNA